MKNYSIKFSGTEYLISAKMPNEAERKLFDHIKIKQGEFAALLAAAIWTITEVL